MTTVTAVKNRPHPGKMMETSSFLQEIPGTQSSPVGSCAEGMLQELSPRFQTSQRFVMMENASVSYPQLWSHWVPSIFSSKYRQLAWRRLSKRVGVGSTW